MKTKLLLLLLLANFSFYAQTNLVPNGGFENWTGNTLQNWTVSNSVTQSTDFAEGQFSAKLTNTGLAPKIIALVPLKAGVTYTIKYKYKYLSNNYGGDHPISLKISQNGSSASISSSAFASNNNWTQKETTFTPDSDLSYELSISTFNFDSATFEVLIDDVFVVDPNESTAQYTLIPDVNFENKLISLGLDSGIPDGKVLTSDISSETDLSVRNSSITNLTGIEAFTELNSLDIAKNQIVNLDLSQNTKLVSLYASENKLTSLDITSNTELESLDCQKNQLTSLNVSNNTKLTSLNLATNQITALDVSHNTVLKSLICGSNKLTNLNIDKNITLVDLRCGNNLLTSLNVSKNPLLVYLICQSNQITSLDVSNNLVISQLMFHYNKVKTIDISNNPELTYFDCLFNELTSIDISKNPKIFEVACQNNQLTYLNLKNGNNAKFDLLYSDFRNNPNLTCIIVDDVANSNTNWSNLKDASASYAANCNLGLDDAVFAKATIYPNPTNGEVNIDNIILEKANVYNELGQLVKTFSLDSNNTNNTINLSGLPKGVYYIYLINQDAASAKKVIVK